MERRHSWEHRAYWGEDLFLGGTDSTASRYRMGPCRRPVSGFASKSGICRRARRVAIKGMAFDLWDGQAWFDGSGKVSRVISLWVNRDTDPTLDSDFASRAVDGNTNGDWSGSSVTHTATSSAGWEVDLGAVMPVEDSLWNRTDSGWGYRLTNYWIFVSNDHITANDVATARTTPAYAYHWPFQCPTTSTARIGRSGRYVRIQLMGRRSLSVWPRCSVGAGDGDEGESRRRRLASQSSTFTDPNTGITYYPEYAVNGDTAGAYNSLGSISHTASETDPHWDLDLGASRAISDVDVSMRTDCTAGNCTDQWPNFYLFVSDQPFTSGTLAQTLTQAA